MDLLDYLDLWLSLRTRIKVWTSADRLRGCFGRNADGGNADGDNRICDGDVVGATESASSDRVCFFVFGRGMGGESWDGGGGRPGPRIEER